MVPLAVAADTLESDFWRVVAPLTDKVLAFSPAATLFTLMLFKLFRKCYFCW